MELDSQVSISGAGRLVEAISLEGYKSILTSQKISLGGLTVLAGTNSSGKSSIMQPLLLLKQTLEAQFDPGSLLLNGPNVRFTSAKQLLTKLDQKAQVNSFCVSFHSKDQSSIALSFGYKSNAGLELQSMTSKLPRSSASVNLKSRPPEIEKLLTRFDKETMHFLKSYRKYGISESSEYSWKVIKDRCFYRLEFIGPRGNAFGIPFPGVGVVSNLVEGLIHVPGLRGNPERTYKTTAVGEKFPGTFENYVASVIVHWQRTNDPRLSSLAKDAEHLGLTWMVRAKQVDDTQVELLVGRVPKKLRSAKDDVVSIADVGFGMSQVLPVLVALLTAKKGQVVYVEQPEIHLHPRAQWNMADILLAAVRKGVHVVVETHSALLLLGIQTRVAEGKVESSEINLHWFRRTPSGSTRISAASLDKFGSFGDWPEDFGEVILRAQSSYLTAVEKRAEAE